MPTSTLSNINQGASNEREPSACFSLCHWRLMQHYAMLDDPNELGISNSEAQALFKTLAPFFAETGLSLRMEGSTRWYIQGQALRGIVLAPLRSAIGKDLYPQLEQQKKLQTLQSEVQMLLYHHPVNNAREAKGLVTVNAFWLHQEGQIAILKSLRKWLTQYLQKLGFTKQSR